MKILVTGGTGNVGAEVVKEKLCLKLYQLLAFGIALVTKHSHLGFMRYNLRHKLIHDAPE